MLYKIILLLVLGVISLTFSAQVIALLKAMLICALILGGVIVGALLAVFIALGIYTVLF